MNSKLDFHRKIGVRSKNHEPKSLIKESENQDHRNSIIVLTNLFIRIIIDKAIYIKMATQIKNKST